MDRPNRYSVPENEGYEPGSNDEVLKNILGIKDSRTIEAVEEKELGRTGLQLPELYDKTYQFTALDVCDIHELWLSGIYPFAGKYRTVNMSKAGFPFAAPGQIDKLMTDFENKYLSRHTPSNYRDEEALAFALGIVHVELIIIHPFREGNGRVARLLANLMAMQGGRGALNYQPIDKTHNLEGFNRYIESIQKGIMEDYEPIKKIFAEILNVS
jgi:cell filamentation protein